MSTTNISKLDRLTKLRNMLLECKNECVKDADEWQIYYDMTKHIIDLINEEEHRLGYMAVYPIVDGQAKAAVFTGTKEQCDTYVEILLNGHPEMKGNIIVLEV